MWKRFIDNCISRYTPGAFITVDEHLFPSKCRCRFTHFMASKPDKYGQKHWLAVDKDVKYVVNGCRYVGRDETHSKDERVSDQVIILLLKMYLKQREERDNRQLFPSVKLASVAKYTKSTSLLGTANKIRKEVPAVTKHIKEPHFTPPHFTNQVMQRLLFKARPIKMWLSSTPSNQHHRFW